MAVSLPEAKNIPNVAAPEGQDTGFVGMLSELSWVEWALIAVGVLLLVLVIALVVRFFVRRARMNKLAGTMREDLLLRRELAAMAAGKDLQAQHREQGARSESIRTEVGITRERLRMHDIDPRKTRTWFLLGEPGSGKSRLMEQGGLEYPAGMNDFTKAAEATPTLNFWLTGHGAVWDIGGRLFLSRWGGRQDNEWQIFLDEYCKVYKGSMPNGVILTIPMDALRLDPPDLRDNKVSLISQELREMSKRIGICCPVWVVVTKCDQLAGFSEFFSLLQDSETEEMLGWENRVSGGEFDPENFNSEYYRLVHKLETLRSSMALNETIWDATTAGQRRADVVNPVYLLPSHFAALRENLGKYLAGVFSYVHEKGEGKAPLRFLGCWFTAAMDHPVVTTERLVINRGADGNLEVAHQDHSPESAHAGGHSLETHGIVTQREKIVSRRSPRHFFTAKLLRDAITRSPEHSEYSAAARRRILRPYWIAAASLVAVSLPLVVASVLCEEDLYDTAHRDLGYWKQVDSLFGSGELGKYPLLEAKDDAQIPLLDEPMGDLAETRRTYLDNMRNMTSLPLTVSSFWRPASLFVDGERGSHLLGNARLFINKAALVGSVTEPATDATRDVFNWRAEHQKESKLQWDRDDTRAFLQLLNISHAGVQLQEGQDVPDTVEYDTLIQIDRHPAQNAITRALWLSCLRVNSSFSQMTMLNGYHRPVSAEAGKALASATTLYCNAVDDMTIYPDLYYRDIRDFTDTLAALLDKKKALETAARDFAQAVEQNNPQEMRRGIDTWKSVYAEVTRLAGEIDEMEEDLELKDEATLSAGVEHIATEMTNRLRDDREKFLNYTLDMESSESAEFLRKLVRQLCKSVDAALPRIAQSAGRTDPALCRFWDRDEEEETRPYRVFLERAARLNALITYPLDAGTPKETYHRRIMRVEDARKAYDARVAALGEAKESPLNEKCWARNWNLLQAKVIRTWINETPDSKIQVMDKLRSMATPEMSNRRLPDLPYTWAARYCMEPAFAPENVRDLTDDLNELLEYVQQHNNIVGDDEAAENAQDAADLTNIIDAFLQDYTVYWTEQLPARYKVREIRTWADFVESAEVLAVFDLTNNVRPFYTRMLEALRIPALADEKRFPLAAAGRAEVAQLLESLNGDAARKLSANLDFISKLSPNPVESWKTLTNMSADELYSTYWAAWNPAGGARLAWWNQYLELGINLLKEEFMKQSVSDLYRALPSLRLFPICNNSRRGESDNLPTIALESLRDSLEHLIGKGNEEEMEKAAEQGLKLNINRDACDLRVATSDARLKAWKKICAAMTLLNDNESVLQGELLLPSSKVRATAIDGEKAEKRLLPVERRYPYCEVRRAGKVEVPLFLLNRSSEQDLPLTGACMGADAPDLEFRFFQKPDGGAPDAVLRLSGAWSLVNLYLRNGVRLSEDKQTAYVPVEFRDKQGFRCVFRIGIRFNRPMIAPQDWPDESLFATALPEETPDLPTLQKKLQKLVRPVFTSGAVTPRQPDAEERAKLAEDVNKLLEDRCSLAFEVVTPGVDSLGDAAGDAARKLAAEYPFFAVGDDQFGTAKMRTLPDATAVSQVLIPGWEPLRVRLYRFATDNYPAVYVTERGNMLDYVIGSAVSYNAVTNCFAVPVQGLDGTQPVKGTLYLRPVVTQSMNDGLLPEEPNDAELLYPDAANAAPLPIP